MIRESEWFHFAGRKSTDFYISNVSISEGLYSEPVIANRSINEVSIRGRKDPYFIDTSESPRVLELRFAFRRGWDDRLIDEVIRWLNVDYYQPLFFNGDVDRVYYAMPIDGINLIHNGLKEGYLTLTMRCNASTGFSHDIITPIFKPKDKITTGKTTIELKNKGHFAIYPDIWIEKIGDGDITIFNKTNGNQEFRLKNIDVGEKVYVDCENEIIETDKERTYHYDNFNDNYLKLLYGVNTLTITNNAIFRFRYRYSFS